MAGGWCAGRQGAISTRKVAPRIERAWEQTKKFGLRLKPPKTKRGLRTISLDDGTIKTLLAEGVRHQGIHTGIPDGGRRRPQPVSPVTGSLMFPATLEIGKELAVTAPRNPRNFSKEFARRANLLGFGRTRFHDLRGIHATALLDAGIPVQIVARHIGDDPATLLPYVKRERTKTADVSPSNAIEALAASFFLVLSGTWSQVGAKQGIVHRSFLIFTPLSD
jgi:integrase